MLHLQKMADSYQRALFGPMGIGMRYNESSMSAELQVWKQGELVWGTHVLSMEKKAIFIMRITICGLWRGDNSKEWIYFWIVISEKYNG